MAIIVVVVVIITTMYIPHAHIHADSCPVACLQATTTNKLSQVKSHRGRAMLHVCQLSSIV